MKRLEQKPCDVHVFVCHGRRCTDGGAPRVKSLLGRLLNSAGVKARVSRTACQGYCKQGPVVFIERPKRRTWGSVRESDTGRLASRLVRLLRRTA